jgi:anionic cell wall polymer biosynthesis LytR-Cps2A-Psr (LCP) family protein
MARQKCVMTALLSQVSPKQALTHFQEIAKASSAMIETDIPGGALNDFAELAMRARHQKISSVSLVPPRINTANPDIPEIRAMVSAAIDRAEGVAPAKAKAAKSAAKAKAKAKKAGSGVVTGGSIGSRNQGYVANETDDVSAAC